MKSVTRAAAFALAVACATSIPIARADAVHTEHVDAELVAERAALVPGAQNWIALRLQIEPGWHTYWRNPGDSGIPTTLRWDLPEGFTAGDIVWPYPERHPLADVMNYGYAGDVLHLVPITVPADARDRVELKAEAKWLVCSDVCIPGKADVKLSLPIAADAPEDPRWHDAFAATRAKVPQTVDWPARFTVDKRDVSLEVTAAQLQPAKDVAFFPYAKDLVNHSADQRRARDGNTLRLSQNLSSFFLSAPGAIDGALVIDGRAYEISAKPGSVAAVAQSEVKAAPEPAPQASSPGLLLALLLAFAGGVILNLMPCVFPVLSLKALAVLEAHDGRERAQAISYTLGVVLSFVIVAGVMLALRAGGQSLGWGFQLQSPVFVAVLVYLFFAMGLALAGMTEFGVRFMGLGQSLTQSKGLGGSFFTGVLAAVVASPCTAPFMGAALGYAVTQPAMVALLIFAMLGFGLASPFLLMGFVPKLAGWLPKPGAWMEGFRELMAFPLFLTVAWLLWVLTRQAGADGAGVVAIGLVVVSFALWTRRFTSTMARVARWVATVAAFALLAHPALRSPHTMEVARTAEASSEPYS
ncbi:MAG TPA: protein-disulfide reductase DsbD domain-containing protein, partial [Nevskiaceae bacterium]|nr:protein-disulfide reductase DsbD domain-containing protein [Nevskiaceae bacterium]